MVPNTRENKSCSDYLSDTVDLLSRSQILVNFRGLLITLISILWEAGQNQHSGQDY